MVTKQTVKKITFFAVANFPPPHIFCALNKILFLYLKHPFDSISINHNDHVVSDVGLVNADGAAGVYLA